MNAVLNIFRQRRYDSLQADFVFILLIGPVIKLDLVWTMADIFNALMSIPNLIAVVVLSPVVVKETNYYLYGNRLDEYDKTKLPVVNK